MEASPVVEKQNVDLNLLTEILQKYKHKKGVIIPLLQEVQALYGYLPKPAFIKIAKATQTDISQIYGVATFYSQFRFTPVGKHMIKVCHGTACHVSNAERITESCEETLGIKDGETTPDREFTLESVACLGCCSLAPVIMVDDTIYGKLTDRETKKVIEKYKK